MTSYRLRVSLYPNPPLFDPDETDEAVWREIAVDDSHTLGDLHEAIFRAFDRWEDHTYEFVTQEDNEMAICRYVHPAMYDGSPSWPSKQPAEIERLLDQAAPADASAAAKDRFRDRHENPPPEGNAATTTIDDLGLEDLGSIYYLFDLEDEWEHQIEIRERQNESLDGGPVVVNTQGDSPSQYPDLE